MNCPKASSNVSCKFSPLVMVVLAFQGRFFKWLPARVSIEVMFHNKTASLVVRVIDIALPALMSE